jgi:competence protein ComEC
MAWLPHQTAGTGGRVRSWGARVELWLEAERDQLALWVPVGLGFGIGAWFGLPDADAWRAFALSTGAAAMLAGLFARGTRLGHSLAWLLALACAGCLLAWGRSDRVAAPRLDRARVAAFTARVVAVDPLPARGKLRLLLATDPESGFRRGYGSIWTRMSSMPRPWLPRARMQASIPPPRPPICGPVQRSRCARGCCRRRRRPCPARTIMRASPGSRG